MNVETEALTEIPTAPTQTPITDEVARLATATQEALKRDLAVFAVEPQDKRPFSRYAPHGFKSATKDENAALKPYLDKYACNIGVACGESNLAVLDIDDEFSCREEFESWMANLPDTFVVHTGRRIGKEGGKRAGLPVYGVHIYFRNAIPDGFVTLGGVECQIKSQGGYVIASGSRHESGEVYEMIHDLPFAATPEAVKNGKAKAEPAQPSGIIISNALIPPNQRNDWLASLAGTLRNKHLSEPAIFEMLKAGVLYQCEDGESYFVQEENKIRDLARRSQKWDAPDAKEPFKLWTLAELREEREASSHSQDVVQGLITQKTVNIGLGDSGLGKTPFFLQMGLCVAFGSPFLNQEVLRGRVLIADYENYGDTDKTLDALAGFLKIPTSEIDGAWIRIARNLDQKSLELAIADFQPTLVIVDSLRGYNAKAETAPDAASDMISKMQKVSQTHGCAWVFIHHPRKIDLKMDIKSRPDLFNKEVDMLTWCQEAAGAHALIQQTHSRIGFAKPKDSKISELGLRGHIKGRGEVGIWLIDREYDDETGEPIGYKRVSGIDLLSVTEKTLFLQLPVGVPMSFGKMLEIVYNGNKSKKRALTRLIHPCLAAGVLIDNGKDSTTSKTYTREK